MDFEYENIIPEPDKICNYLYIHVLIFNYKFDLKNLIKRYEEKGWKYRKDISDRFNLYFEYPELTNYYIKE